MVHGRARRTFTYVILVCALVGAWMPTEARSAQATMRWDYTASGAAGFVLYCGVTHGSYSIRVDVGNTTTYTLGGLTAGVTYYCAATAYDAAKRESVYSSEVTLSIPPTVSGAPQVIARTPLASATGVSIATAITATFSEPVQQSTIAFTLAGPAGAVVPATSTYNSGSLTAALQPSARLAASTTYTATIAGAKDTAGNAMPAPVTWAFTTGTAQTNCPCTIWPSTATPVSAADPDSSAVELGVKFRADVNGWITGIRFYKSSLNTGTHIGSLWTANGTWLASATFVNETTSGWQQVSFSAPVPIIAGTTYVASYHVNGGHYAGDNGYFANNTAATGVIHALKDGTDGGNGVFAYNSGVTFPTNTYKSNNYWVDVVFTTTAPNCPCTLWPPSVTPAMASDPDSQPVELGVKFRADISGQITGIRFYKSTANTGTHVASLWTSTGTLLASANFGTETPSGWQQVNFSTPVAIAAGNLYVASYHTNTGHYAADQGYFANGGVDNGLLHALRDGISGGNGVFAYASASTFPANTYRSSNYWVDIVFKSP
jgi:hypothetical protein